MELGVGSVIRNGAIPPKWGVARGAGPRFAQPVVTRVEPGKCGVSRSAAGVASKTMCQYHAALTNSISPPPIFQCDRLVLTPPAAQSVHDVLLSWDLLSHFYTSREHPQVDRINILLFVHGILLFKMFNRLAGYLLNQRVGISFAIRLWLCLTNSLSILFQLTLGKTALCLMGCLSSASSLLGAPLVRSQVTRSFSIQQMYVMLFCLGNKL